MSTNFLKTLIKGIGHEKASLMFDGLGSAEFNTFIDTGSYTLNAAFGGSLFSGFADNKIGGLAGESATGKTYLLLGIVRSFLKRFPTAIIIFCDTEGATTKKMMEDRGINTENVALLEPPTVEEFRDLILRTLTTYEEMPVVKGEEKPRMLICLDSLGQLTTMKELGNAEGEKNKADMGNRSTIIRSAFRVITLKAARLNVPILVTNHTYANISKYGAGQTMGGGGGLKYAASTILQLSKSKLKEDDEVIGSALKVKITKSRLSRENQEVETRILYDGGIDRYYGLLEMAIESSVWKKMSTKVAIDFFTAEEAIVLNEGRKEKDYVKDGDAKTLLFGKEIEDNPTKYFTREILEKIDIWVKVNYQYGAFADADEILEKSELLDKELQDEN
jgi:RecA/RadA recombinase